MLCCFPLVCWNSGCYSEIMLVDQLDSPPATPQPNMLTNQYPAPPMHQRCPTLPHHVSTACNHHLNSLAP